MDSEKPRSNPSRWALVAVVVISVVAIYFWRQSNKQPRPSSSNPVLSPPNAEAALVESKGLQELSSENNVPANTLSPENKRLGEAVMNALQLAGDGKDRAKLQQAPAAVGTVIQQHPDYADAYVLRATLLLMSSGSDLQQIRSDLDAALKYHSSHKYDSAYGSDASIYGLRAKADVLAGDHQRAMIDLESAVEVDPGTPNEVFNTGGVKPEEDANPTALTRKDLDILVSKYPRDFRAYMFRGLFYSSFTLYSENYYAPTFADLNRALDMNPNSALVHYFLGRIAQRMTFWTKAAARDISDINGASGGYKAKTHQKALQHFDAAIQLDPNFALAYADAAEELLSLKRYSDAIPYYDKAIDLRPADAGAYNDEKERLGERQLPLAATRGESTFVPLLENYIGVAKLLITVAAASIAFGGNQNSNIGVYLAKIVLAFSILYGVAFAALLQYFYDEYSQNVNAYTPWRYSMIEALGFSALGSFVSGFLLWAFHLR